MVLCAPHRGSYGRTTEDPVQRRTDATPSAGPRHSGQTRGERCLLGQKARRRKREVQEPLPVGVYLPSHRLLVATDLAVEEIGNRVGYRDPGYVVRSFRRSHSTTPLRWRRAGRP